MLKVVHIKETTTKNMMPLNYATDTQKKTHPEAWKFRAGKIRFSGALKSVLLKTSSGEHCAPCDFIRYTCSPPCVPSHASNEIYYGKMKQYNNIL